MMTLGVRKRSVWWQLFWAMLFYVILIFNFWQFGSDFKNHWLRYILIFGAMVGINGFYAEGIRKMGLWPHDFKACFLVYGKSLLGLAVLIIFLGILSGTPRYHNTNEWIINFVKYLGWGFLQQYLLNGFFVNRLVGYLGTDRNGQIPVIAGSLFALAHLPNWILMIVAFFGGWICVKIFLNQKHGGNLYFLGLAHGVVGFLLLSFLPYFMSRGFVVGPRYFQN